MVQQFLKKFREEFNFDINDSLSVMHHAGDDLIPVKDYLTQNSKAPRELLDKVFDEKNRLTASMDTTTDVYSLYPSEINLFFKNMLQPLYELVDYSLNATHIHGFNVHGEPHIAQVTEVAFSLLISGKYDIETQKRAMVATRVHDLGNIFSRHFHSYISPSVAKKLFPQLLKHAQNWENIEQAVMVHDEKVMREFLDSLSTSNVHDIIEGMRKKLSPEALALFIADKTDIGRHRISVKAASPEAVDDNFHIVANLLGGTESLRLSADGKKFYWNVRFIPEFSEEELNLHYSSLAKQRSRHEGMRVYVPKHMMDLFHNAVPIPNFDAWTDLLWSLYFDRIVMTIMAAFALYPDLSEFEIMMRDKVDVQWHYGRFNGIVISRNTVDQQINELKTIYLPKHLKDKTKVEVLVAEK